jgi:hypothetical protein
MPVPLGAFANQSYNQSHGFERIPVELSKVSPSLPNFDDQISSGYDAIAFLEDSQLLKISLKILVLLNLFC